MTNVGVVGWAPEGFVRLNGVLWEIPEGWTAEDCSRVKMIYADVESLKSVHVPLFALEYHHQVEPKLHSDFKGMRLKLNYDDHGELVWFQNFDWCINGKVHKTLKRELKRTKRGKLNKLNKQGKWVKKQKVEQNVAGLETHMEMMRLENAPADET